MKKILSIDPGLTTGVAAYTDQGKLKFTLSCSSYELLSNGFLNKIISLSSPDIVLIEGVPKHRPNIEQAVLVKDTIKWFMIAGFDVEEIQPSQWKGFVERVEIPCQHMRDAASIGAWYIKRENQ